jgi:hypothetical protein
MINDSRIELRCRKCNRMADWWHVFFIPLRQTWSEEERKAMR